MFLRFCLLRLIILYITVAGVGGADLADENIDDPEAKSRARNIKVKKRLSLWTLKTFTAAVTGISITLNIHRRIKCKELIKSGIQIIN